MVNFVSEYALGGFGRLMIVGGLFGLVGNAALLGALDSAGVVSLRSIVGALMIINILAITLVLIFPVDPIAATFSDGGGPSFTRSGWIHAIAGLVASVAKIMVAVLITVVIVRSSWLVSGYRVLVPLCAGAPIAYVAMLMTQPATYPAGLYQRLFLIAIIGWSLTVAFGLFAGKFGNADRVSRGA